MGCNHNSAVSLEAFNKNAAGIYHYRQILRLAGSNLSGRPAAWLAILPFMLLVCCCVAGNFLLERQMIQMAGRDAEEVLEGSDFSGERLQRGGLSLAKRFAAGSAARGVTAGFTNWFELLAADRILVFSWPAFSNSGSVTWRANNTNKVVEVFLLKWQG